MDKAIVCRPYQVYIYFIPFILFCEIFAFIIVGCNLVAGLFDWLMFTVGILCIWLTKVLYDASNIVVIVEEIALQIVGGNYNQYRYILWKELSYGYYTRSFKGHLFLVLSSKELGSKEVKKLVNRGANFYKICIDDTIIIPITFLKNASQLKEMIVNHELHVDGY